MPKPTFDIMEWFGDVYSYNLVKNQELEGKKHGDYELSLESCMNVSGFDD